MVEKTHERVGKVARSHLVGSALQRMRQIDVFNIGCPAHHVMARIGNKWTLLVIYALTQGTKRYTDLQRQIPTISPKMLTQVLRRLEKDSLVSRQVHPIVPPMVEYSLTSLGMSLANPLAELCMWANDNSLELEKAWLLPSTGNDGLRRCGTDLAQSDQ